MAPDPRKKPNPLPLGSFQGPLSTGKPTKTGAAWRMNSFQKPKDTHTHKQKERRKQKHLGKKKKKHAGNKEGPKQRTFIMVLSHLLPGIGELVQTPKLRTQLGVWIRL